MRVLPIVILLIAAISSCIDTVPYGTLIELEVEEHVLFNYENEVANCVHDATISQMLFCVENWAGPREEPESNCQRDPFSHA